MQSVILALKCNFAVKFKMLVNRRKKTDRPLQRKAAQGYVYVMGPQENSCICEERRFKSLNHK